MSDINNPLKQDHRLPLDRVIGQLTSYTREAVQKKTGER